MTPNPHDKIADKLRQEVHDALHYKWNDFFCRGPSDTGHGIDVRCNRVKSDGVTYIVSAVLTHKGQPYRTGGAWSGDWAEYSDQPEKMVKDAVADMSYHFFAHVFLQ